MDLEGEDHRTMNAAQTKCRSGDGVAALAMAALAAILGSLSAEPEQAQLPTIPKPEVVEYESFNVVGIELPDAERKPYLITYAWAALCPKMSSIKQQVHPERLYGLWYKKPGAEKHSYLVGVEVKELEDVPAGMVTCTVPAAKFVRVVHVGRIGTIPLTYRAVTEWMRETGARHADAPTFEIYDTTQPLSNDYKVLVHEPIR